MTKDISELRYRQSLPLEDKIEMSYCNIEMWWKHWDEQIYVAFSGGKDSSVVRDLTHRLFPDVPSVYSDTGLEYPELKQFVRSLPDVTVIRPKLSYRQVIEKYGYALVSKEQSRYIYEYRTTHSDKLRDIRLNGNRWGYGKISKKYLHLLDAPFKVSHKCCDVLKKDPFKIYEKSSGRHGMLGTLAVESRMRTETWLRFGCNAFDVKRPISTPIAFWTEQDVLQYVHKYHVAIPSIYGDVVQKEDGTFATTGVHRSGCMWCLFGLGMETEQNGFDENRFQKMKRTHPKIWEYCVNDMGIGAVLDYIGIKYE